MKRKKLLLTGLVVAALVTSGIIYAADHIDAPAVTGQSTDITDMYCYQSTTNAANLVFVGNTQGLLSPAATATAKFDANTLIQFNIDVDADNVEDYVIQALYDGSGKMNFYGPVKPTITGLKSQLEGSPTASVAVTTYGSSATVATGSNGMQVFAGPRDDPFFFDLTQYKHIVDATNAANSFNNPGTDAFAGLNVLSIVAEVPKALFGTVASGKINVWLTTKKKI